MSGIAGVYNFSYKKVERDILDRMGNAIRYRGPDSSKVYVNKDRNLGLICRHLKIKDGE